MPLGCPALFLPCACNLKARASENPLLSNHHLLVVQYNKRDLQETASGLLPPEVLERDLNSMLKVPSFSASALKGNGVFETLREISKLVVKDVSRKTMLGV
jgi:hypothetical protein